MRYKDQVLLGQTGLVGFLFRSNRRPRRQVSPGHLVFEQVCGLSPPHQRPQARGAAVLSPPPSGRLTVPMRLTVFRQGP